MHQAGKTTHLLYAGALVEFRFSNLIFCVTSESAGFLKQNDKGEWECSHSNVLYDTIQCPPDHFKLPLAEYEQSCSKAGLACPEGSKCYCRPCLRAFEVDIVNWTEEIASGNVLHPTGCSKMSVCGSFEQTKTVTFVLVDNQKRVNPDIEVKIHFHENTYVVPAEPENRPGHENQYLVSWTAQVTGVAIMEVFFDGEQIPQSPVRILVNSRNCEMEYPGEKRDSNAHGDCVCRHGTVDVHGRCVESIYIAVALSCLAVLFISILGSFYLRYKTKMADQMWQVDIRDLTFDDPAEIIGEGSFGVVLACEYRGTKVALKKAVRNKKGKSKVGISGQNRKVFSLWSAGSSNPDARQVTMQIPNSSGHDSTGGTSDKSCDVISLDTNDNFPEIDMEFGSSMPQEDGNRSGDINFDFMASGSKKKTFWSGFFGKKDGHSERFNEVLFGSGAASKSTRSVSNTLFPWFSERSRARKEFMAEMRVLSRLRHPVCAILRSTVQRLVS